jgi:hypothetical protein
MKEEFKRLFTRPFLYILSGMIFMAMVISIARTNWFLFCYIPLMLAAIGISLNNIPMYPEATLPGKWMRVIFFSLGMIIAEIIYLLGFLMRNRFDLSHEAWISTISVVGIELILALLAFVLFWSIAEGVRYLFKKYLG